VSNSHPSVCPRCGHAWWKHDARLFDSCVGNKEGGSPDEKCGCNMVREQAEVQDAGR